MEAFANKNEAKSQATVTFESRDEKTENGPTRCDMAMDNAIARIEIAEDEYDYTIKFLKELYFLVF